MEDIDPLGELGLTGGPDLLRAAVEAADDVILITSAELTAPGPVIQYVNPAFTRMTGYRPDEVIGRSPRILQGPRTDRAVLDRLKRDLASCGRFNGETVNYRKDDSAFILSWHITPVRDRAGAVTRWLAVQRDVTAQRGTEAQLREVEERYRIAALATNDVIWDWDLTTDRIAWNEALGSRLGYAPDAVDPSSRWWSDRIHSDDHDRVMVSLAAFIDHGDTHWAEEYRFRRADGSHADILDRGCVIRDAEGRAVRMVGAMLDLSEERRAARALRESEERHRLAVEVAGLATWDVNLLTGERQWSPEFYRMLGLPEGTTTDPERVLARLHPDDRPRLTAQIEAAWAGKVDFPFTGDFRYRGPGDDKRWVTVRGKLLRDESGRPVRFITAIRDVTEEHRTREHIRWSANHDELTRLPNRALFKECLEQHLTGSGQRVGLFLLDVDHFKTINDTLGHDAGDAVLRAFAARLRTILPHAYTLARLGGDEFAVIAPGIRDPRDLRTLADAMLLQLQEPFDHDGRPLDGRATIGASLYPDHGRTSADLLKHADIALYEAKAAGRARLMIFEPKMRMAPQMRASMLNIAREAVEGDAILPFYQPKVSLHDGRVVGAEALLRWRNPAGDIELPAGIEPAFEDPYLAIAIGERMFERVLADLRRWLDAGIAFGRVAVNASPAEFRREGFADGFLGRLQASGVPASHIELEVTESVFLGQGAAWAGRELALLHSQGVRIALDDFGTGFASLTHLKQFPVTTLKVDRSFVRDLSTDAEDAAIVRAVLGLGASLGIETVAEGVETLEQAAHLWAQGCDVGQGYLFGRPLPANEATAALRDWHTDPLWKG